MDSPKAETSDAIQRTLLMTLLRNGRTVQLRVLGSSMLPALWPGDVLTIEPVHGDAVPGEIVAIDEDARLIIHRLVVSGSLLESRDWITRGDSQPSCDPPTSSSRILGRVCQVTRGKKTFVPQNEPGLFGNVISRVLANCDLFRRLAVRGYRGWQLIEHWNSEPSRRTPAREFSASK